MDIDYQEEVKEPGEYSAKFCFDNSADRSAG